VRGTFFRLNVKGCDLKNTNSDGANEMSTTVLYTKKQLVGERYTPESLERLSLAIRATLLHDRVSERELAELASISHNALNKYVRGLVREPQRKVLEAIAPHLYRVKSVDKDQVVIDFSQKYGDEWRELDVIASTDYPQQKSETPSRRKTDWSSN
jgi:transcriptional regulator with XRE-family HTH domain